MAAVDANSITSVSALPEGNVHAMRSMDLLVDFPVEVTDIILSQLSEIDLARVALCSWGWRERSNSDSLWQPICELRGWVRYGTVVDLNLDDSFLSHSKVITRSDTETLSPTCEWKAVFLKAMNLEKNWAEGRYLRISFPMQRLSSKVQCACDGSFFVRSYTCRIEIWNLTSRPKEEPTDFETMQHLDLKCWWQPHKLLVSKGIGLVIGRYKHGCFVRTFDCRNAKWLAAFERDWIGFWSRYRVDGETMIGQSDLREFRVWSSIDGTHRHTLTGHTSNILDLALRGDIAVSAAENLRLWNLKEGECLRIFECPRTNCGFSICRLSAEHVMGGYGGSTSGMTMSFWDLKSGCCATIEGVEWRMFRHDYSGFEVWSFEHEQGQFRRLSTSKLLEFKDLEAIWADDTKLVFKAGSKWEQREVLNDKQKRDCGHADGKRRSITNAFKRLFNRKGDKRSRHLSSSSESAADREEDCSWDFLHVLHFW